MGTFLDGRLSISYQRVGGASGYVALGSPIPAGRYRMYVATLKPVRVTLRFPGLGGTSRLTVTDDEPIQIAALP